jgi:hypothetical protein
MKCREAGKKLHNEELHVLYFLSHIIKVIKSRIGGECSAHGGDEK